MSDLLKIAQAATADAKRIAELEAEVQRLKAKISNAAKRLYAMLEGVEEPPVVQAWEPITLDALFKQVRDAETYFREQARRPHSPIGLSR